MVLALPAAVPRWSGGPRPELTRAARASMTARSTKTWTGASISKVPSDPQRRLVFVSLSSSRLLISSDVHQNYGYQWCLKLLGVYQCDMVRDLRCFPPSPYLPPSIPYPRHVCFETAFVLRSHVGNCTYRQNPTCSQSSCHPTLPPSLIVVQIVIDTWPTTTVSVRRGEVAIPS